MKIINLQKERKILRELLIGLAGAVAVLLGTSLDRGIFETNRSMVVPFTPWIAIWLLLQLISLFFMVGILVLKDWRGVPFEEKAGLFFGYAVVFWAGLLAFSLRIAVLLSFYFHLMVFILGAVLTAGYLIYRLNRNQAGELFP